MKGKAEVSRRNFLRETGAMIGGATVATVTPLPAAGQVQLTLFDPTGAQEITHLFASRLPDLNGKVTAELAVDPTKWQPHRTMPYIEELLKKQFPEYPIHPDARVSDGGFKSAATRLSRWCRWKPDESC